MSMTAAAAILRNLFIASVSVSYRRNPDIFPPALHSLSIAVGPHPRIRANRDARGRKAWIALIRVLRPRPLAFPARSPQEETHAPTRNGMAATMGCASY